MSYHGIMSTQSLSANGRLSQFVEAQNWNGELQWGCQKSQLKSTTILVSLIVYLSSNYWTH